jgi:hypothetical protein
MDQALNRAARNALPPKNATKLEVTQYLAQDNIARTTIYAGNTADLLDPTSTRFTYGPTSVRKKCYVNGSEPYARISKASYQSHQESVRQEQTGVASEQKRRCYV